MSKRTTLLLHISAWLILFLTPLSFVNHGNGVELLQFMAVSVAPLSVLVVFYANYCWLTPRFFVTGEKRYYWIINVLMVIGLGIGVHYWMRFVHTLFDPSNGHHYEPSVLDTLVFIVRDVFQLVISAAIATALQLAMRWQHAEQARTEAEAARTEAELSNLRSQINPHFLLNTLNNIYALTAFDTGRAQQAIEQLSKLLRHMLYEGSGNNRQQPSRFSDEARFLENYVNLMKIRLTDNVDVVFQVEQKADLPVSPLLFISLAENAFKHGISPTEPSFVHIKLAADKCQLVCDIENSNFPKTAQDRSGHGIGLQQVQRRLDLAYPGKYTWERGVSSDGKTYRSVITIHYS